MLKPYNEQFYSIFFFVTIYLGRSFDVFRVTSFILVYWQNPSFGLVALASLGALRAPQA